MNMNRHSARLMLMLAAFVAGLALFGAAIFIVTGRSPVSAPLQAAIGGPFRLVDQNGQPFTEQNVKGKPHLVFFGFTHCPDICPTTLFEVSEIMRSLGKDADKFAALFITVDPARDTPAVLKDYLSNFDPHLVGLTGDEAAIQTVGRQYRVYFKKVPTESGYTMDHTAIVYLMDKNGRFVAPFNVKRQPQDAAADLRRYL
jgi:protein SCO1/2